ncbi:urease accessory protein UreH domain-containing protein [Merismopedia glauca]|uniref:Ferric reductase n=1 Tax=Merismopedia glauca CCAP 1448/3 TaxID=1296344 RepID=A0A2T1C0Y1_9CYAN|nr:sulfite exporter TauE/SafE family protein [Merismopedia glauca]PSB01935.1 ferric reductase [Merismopedia glauca CCAP 1448/3]
MLDLFLIAALGFLGSFGHCVGMCGPLSVAFSLSQKSDLQGSWRSQLLFHTLLNLGRILSYVLVGAGIGVLGSFLIASGQLTGIESSLRRGLALLTGILLVWLGIGQISPKLLPRIPILHPLSTPEQHQRLNRAMMHLSSSNKWWTPALLGITWGLLPCGFLYTAQVKAAATGNMWLGALTMLAFGLGTFPSMLGVGVSAAFLSSDRRSQLFRLGGWVTLTVGLLTLLRTEAMEDYTGHAAIFCLALALIARPISRLWVFPLKYRRALGVGGFIFSLFHTLHSLEHTFNWDLSGLSFFLPVYQVGMWMGIVALGLMIPAVLTSFDSMVKALGTRWRKIHLLTVPAFILCVMHTILVGSHYLGAIPATNWEKTGAIALGIILLGVLLIRCRWVWVLLSLEKFYFDA